MITDTGGKTIILPAQNLTCIYKKYLNIANSCRKCNDGPKKLTHSLFHLEINLRNDAILADIL